MLPAPGCAVLCCGARTANAQQRHWNLVQDWNGRNPPPINEYWDFPHHANGQFFGQWQGLESYGALPNNNGAQFILKCIGATTTWSGYWGMGDGILSDVTFEPGTLAWTGYEDIVWTAADYAGPIHILATFANLHQGHTGGQELVVLHNGIGVWGSGYGESYTFDKDLTVAIGDQITFRYGNGHVPYSVKRLDIDIASVPCGNETVNWTNEQGGSWDLASNWNPSGRPDSSKIATFSLDEHYIVTLPDHREIAGVVVNAGSVYFSFGTSQLSRRPPGACPTSRS